MPSRALLAYGGVSFIGGKSMSKAIVNTVNQDKSFSVKNLITGYTIGELYALWKNFKDDVDADKILSDFMNTDRKTAAALINEFECRYEANRLNAHNRGKEGRLRKHI
jgi:hypothetical protein